MSTSWTVNGFPLTELELCEPATGAWTAQLSCASDVDLVEPIVIRCENGPHEWVGAIVQQRTNKGRAEAYVVGGKNKLRTVVRSRGYRQATAASIVRDIMSDCGETLSPSAKPTGTLAHWARLAHTGADALAAINATTGDAYRVERDGTIYVGPVAYTAAETEGFVVYQDNASRRTEYSLQAPDIKAGTIVDGFKVARVDYSVRASSVSAMVVWGVE